MSGNKAIPVQTTAWPSRLAAAFFSLCVMFALMGGTASAQLSGKGAISGTIYDPSGAAVPGAVVTITNNATGVTAKITANGEGDYEAPSLRVGAYTISASAPGFANVVANNITVSVGGRERIDLSLKTGATQTTVQVSDVAHIGQLLRIWRAVEFVRVEAQGVGQAGLGVEVDE